MATVMKEEHHERLRIFREVQGVEKALVQQIVQAVEPPYLASIRDRNSNSLLGTVHQILDHLQTVYGRISPQMLEDREQELLTMIYYNTQYPIEIVFNAVEDYVDFAELGHQPLTQRQTIAKAYTILNKTRRFENDITDWNRRPNVDKTWLNFKNHFRHAHQEFRETTDVTLEESDLQCNNVNLVQKVVYGLQGAMTTDTSTSDTSTEEALLQMANSATRTTETQQQLQAQLQQIQQVMGLLQTQMAIQHQPSPQIQFQQSQQYGQFPPNHQQQYVPTGQQYQQFQPRGGCNSYDYQGCGGGRGGRGGNPPGVRNSSKYCWTHGGCGQTSATCNTKLPGHQDNATFQNKVGGNTNNCPP
jgi:hypothetical protein